MDLIKSIRDSIRAIPDYPKPGITFRDISPLLQSKDAFKSTIEAFAQRYQELGIDQIAAVEARGFIFGAAVADRLGAGFVPIRKPNKLPSTTIQTSYELEYGEGSLEIHDDAIDKGQKVLIVDDLLATGGTAQAAVQLIKKLGGIVQGVVFLIELEGLKGRSKLLDENIVSILKY